MAKTRIIVIDHDETFLELMLQFLEDENYLTTICRDREAAAQAIQEKRPDLLIVDLQLDNSEPAWEILHDIRQNPQTAGVPTIVTTTDERLLREDGDEKQRYEVELLIKPFDLDELLTLIHRLLVAPE